jgi:hypothetical protein
MEQYRQCSKCKETKLLTEYYKRSQSKDDGVARQCKICTNANYKAYWKRTAIKQSEKRHARQIWVDIQNNEHSKSEILYW